MWKVFPRFLLTSKKFTIYFFIAIYVFVVGVWSGTKLDLVRSISGLDIFPEGGVEQTPGGSQLQFPKQSYTDPAPYPQAVFLPK